MAETPKLKKSGFWFFDHKRVNFQYFQKQKKAPYSRASYLFCIWVTKVSHKKCYHAKIRYVFAFLPKKGSLIFKIQKNGWPDKFYCPKDSKKVNIFEIGSLEVYDRGGGVAQGLHCIASLHVYIYIKPYT